MSGVNRTMLKNEEVLADRESYLKFWDIVINKVIQDYQERFIEVFVEEDAKEDIWEEYCRFKELIEEDGEDDDKNNSSNVTPK